MGWWWEARKVFGSGLLGSDARAGIYVDAIPSFTEDLPAFGNNALLLCTLPFEGDMSPPNPDYAPTFYLCRPKSSALTVLRDPQAGAPGRASG